MPYLQKTVQRVSLTITGPGPSFFSPSLPSSPSFQSFAAASSPFASSPPSSSHPISTQPCISTRSVLFRNKAEKRKCDRPTDWRTDTPSCRVASSRLKSVFSCTSFDDQRHFVTPGPYPEARTRVPLLSVKFRSVPSFDKKTEKNVTFRFLKKTWKIPFGFVSFHVIHQSIYIAIHWGQLKYS